MGRGLAGRRRPGAGRRGRSAPVLLLDRAGPVRAHPGADALDRADGAAGMARCSRVRLAGPDPVDVSPVAGRRAAGGAHLGVDLVGALPGGVPDGVGAARCAAAALGRAAGGCADGGADGTADLAVGEPERAGVVATVVPGELLRADGRGAVLPGGAARADVRPARGSG